MKKEIKTNAMRFLDKNKIYYETHYYECDEFVDGIEVAVKSEQPLEKIFKTLVLQGKSKAYYVCLIPVAEKLDFKKVAKVFDEKFVEMVPVKNINQITGYVRGGCSPLGMKKQFSTVIHKTALEQEYVIFSGGRLGTEIKLNPKDFVKVINSKVEDIVELSHVE